MSRVKVIGGDFGTGSGDAGMAGLWVMTSKSGWFGKTILHSEVASVEVTAHLGSHNNLGNTLVAMAAGAVVADFAGSVIAGSAAYHAGSMYEVCLTLKDGRSLSLRLEGGALQRIERKIQGY